MIRKVFAATAFLAAAAFFSVSQTGCSDSNQQAQEQLRDSLRQEQVWTGPSANQIPYYSRPDGPEIWYGRELIAHTAKYLGPKGSVMQISNGMNCQNCHLDAGTKPWGNNYGAVYSTYPKFRARSGTEETIYKRVNDCFERSLNGKALDTNGREMKAIYAFIKWLGEKVPKGTAPKGSGIEELKYLDRAADPVRGKAVYVQKCQTCHGANGEGMMGIDGNEYQYPPLWGPHSYNTGAGLYRLSRFAGYVKNNMPQGADYHNPQLSVEEAWDVAAFVNSQPRPVKDLSGDWPDISKKPVDHPFGPFADPFSEAQHKYGPFGPIKDWYEQQKKAARQVTKN
ncbi:MAG: c-type cytochrome [Lacibacter sp.]